MCPRPSRQDDGGADTRTTFDGTTIAAGTVVTAMGRAGQPCISISRTPEVGTRLGLVVTLALEDITRRQAGQETHPWFSISRTISIGTVGTHLAWIALEHVVVLRQTGQETGGAHVPHR